MIFHFFLFLGNFFLSCVRPLYQAQQPRDFSPSFFFFFFFFFKFFYVIICFLIYGLFWLIFFLSFVIPLYQPQQPRFFSPSFFFFFFGKNFKVSKFAFESMPHFVEFQYPLKTIPFPFYFSITFVLSHSSLLYWYVSISVFSILYTKL